MFVLVWTYIDIYIYSYVHRYIHILCTCTLSMCMTEIDAHVLCHGVYVNASTLSAGIQNCAWSSRCPWRDLAPRNVSCTSKSPSWLADGGCSPCSIYQGAAVVAVLVIVLVVLLVPVRVRLFEELGSFKESYVKIRGRAGRKKKRKRSGRSRQIRLVL